MKFAFKTMLYVLSIVFIVLGVTNVLNTAAMIALGIIIFSVATFWAMYDTENNEADVFFLKERVKKLEEQFKNNEDNHE